MSAQYIIKKPLMTEKNTFHLEDNTYVFEVAKSASKTDVREAIEKMFNVKVAGVRTIVGRGRSKRTRFGTTKVKYYKKAFVKLKEGEKIGLFEGA